MLAFKQQAFQKVKSQINIDRNLNYFGQQVGASVCNLDPMGS